MSHYHKKPFYLKNINNTEVLESPIHGYGLFSTDFIPKDTLMCILSGQIVSVKEFEKLRSSNLFSVENFVEKHNIGEDKILISPFRTSYSYINHSERIEHLREEISDNIIKVYAKFNIEKNTEILSIYNLKKHIDVLGGFNVCFTIQSN